MMLHKGNYFYIAKKKKFLGRFFMICQHIGKKICCVCKKICCICVCVYKNFCQHIGKKIYCVCKNFCQHIGKKICCVCKIFANVCKKICQYVGKLSTNSKSTLVRL